ncbi:hypothetical protein BH18ACI5_BH18ACI5_06770 [soil metagenome]
MSERQAVSLPDGLEQTIAAVIAGCRKKNVEINEEAVREKMIDRLYKDFKEFECEWPTVQYKILAVAGLSGRLAAVYARLDKVEVAQWHQARKGLRDGKAECVEAVGLILAKHCANADFEHD